MIATAFTVFGLILDVAGVLIIFNYDPGPKPDPHTVMEEGGRDYVEIDFAYSAKRRVSIRGLIALIAGFVLQIIGASWDYIVCLL